MTVIQRSRFRGCLLGALIGDCLGAPFEGFGLDVSTSKKAIASQMRVNNLIEILHKGHDVKKAGAYYYTDDTAMLRSVASSLIDCGKYDPKDMVWRFADTFYNDVRSRAYGGAIGLIFVRIKDWGRDGILDPYAPASQQFDGQGSYGNGGAMRVAPVALWSALDSLNIAQLAKEQCRLTHTHPDGIMGAVMQARAIWLALTSPSTECLDPLNFISKLRPHMEQDANNMYTNSESNPYITKLDTFPSLLERTASPTKIVETLGHGIAASESVPTAVYAFLRGLQPIDGVTFSTGKKSSLAGCFKSSDNIENPLLRTIAGAIGLAGDTDTIATMTGAIAGAYYGDNDVPDWAYKLEGAKVAISLADALHDRYCKLPNDN